ncbi:MAG: MBL fold metallo-hydrolase [Acidobacteria bacterium]|nr:MAG: MBL fold metallo-hydrolase [Acidobacteriota bacterium]
MRKRLLFLIAFAALLIFAVAWAQGSNALNIYFVDVEGGQSTLFVSPSGQSMLVDTGFPGERDATRIAAMAKEAGVSKIDYLVITHYHGDHVGGVTELAKRLPIQTFIDHGPSAEQTLNVPQSYEAYLSVRDKGPHQHIVAKPGLKLPIKGIDVEVVSAATELINKPLPGAGAPNPLCSEFQPKDETKDPLLGGENAQSVGTVISLGKFRMVDFGDLTWNHEHGLACPRNLIGQVDLYLTTHHGQNISGLPMLVYALHPRAAVMNNGAKKGGASDTFQILHKAPGSPDLWQLHYALDAKELNSVEQFIANPDETTAHYIRVTARLDGSFTITNSRNGYHKDYGPRS